MDISNSDLDDITNLIDDADYSFNAPKNVEVSDVQEKGNEEGNKSPRNFAFDNNTPRKVYTLIEPGGKEISILPQGWIVVPHNSGMRVYLHTDSRVVCMSQPYSIGALAVRTHGVPVDAIPCLAYKRALKAEKKCKGLDEVLSDKVTVETQTDLSLLSVGAFFPVDVVAQSSDTDKPLNISQNLSQESKEVDNYLPKYTENSHQSYPLPHPPLSSHSNEYQVPIPSGPSYILDEDSEVIPRPPSLPPPPPEGEYEDCHASNFDLSLLPLSCPFSQSSKHSINIDSSKEPQIVPKCSVTHDSQSHDNIAEIDSSTLAELATNCSDISSTDFVPSPSAFPIDETIPDKEDGEITTDEDDSVEKLLQLSAEKEKRLKEEMDLKNRKSFEKYPGKDKHLSSHRETASSSAPVKNLNPNKSPSKRKRSHRRDKSPISPSVSNRHLSSLVSDKSSPSSSQKWSSNRRSSLGPSDEPKKPRYDSDKPSHLSSHPSRESSIDNSSSKLTISSSKKEKASPKVSDKKALPLTNVTFRMDLSQVQPKISVVNKKIKNPLESPTIRQSIPATTSLCHNQTDVVSHDATVQDPLPPKSPNKSCRKWDKAPNVSTASETPTEVPSDSLPIVEAKVYTFDEKLDDSMLTPEQVNEYCRRLFKFYVKPIVCKRKTFARRTFHRRRNQKESRQKQIDKSEDDEECEEGEYLEDKNELTKFAGDANSMMKSDGIEIKISGTSKREFINTTRKSAVCILNEYCHQALRSPIVYNFETQSNAVHLYKATAMIKGIPHCWGTGQSKKLAKLDAAKKTLEMLIPDYNKIANSSGNPLTSKDLKIFDNIKLSDPRANDFLLRMNLPTPSALLDECMKRNFLCRDTSDSKMTKVDHRNVFCLTLGSHSVQVSCRNKRDGKQLASQAMLAKLHPEIQNLSGILKLYGPGSIPHLKTELDEIKDIQFKEKGGVKTGLIAILKAKMRELAKQWDEEGKTNKAKFNAPAPDIPHFIFHPDAESGIYNFSKPSTAETTPTSLQQ